MRLLSGAMQMSGATRNEQGREVGRAEVSTTLRARWRAGGKPYTLVLTVPRVVSGRPQRIELRDAGAAE